MPATYVDVRVRRNQLRVPEPEVRRGEGGCARAGLSRAGEEPGDAPLPAPRSLCPTGGAPRPRPRRALPLSG